MSVSDVDSMASPTRSPMSSGRAAFGLVIAVVYCIPAAWPYLFGTVYSAYPLAYLLTTMPVRRARWGPSPKRRAAALLFAVIVFVGWPALLFYLVFAEDFEATAAGLVVLFAWGLVMLPVLMAGILAFMIVPLPSFRRSQL